MKKRILLLPAFLILINSFAAFPVAKQVEPTLPELREQGGNQITEVIGRMSIQDFEKLSGKKLNFIEKLVFKIEKKHFVNQLKRREGSSDFKWLGFAAGLLYGPFGLLAVYIFSKDTNYRRSALLGFKIWLLVLGVYLLILLAIAGGKFK